MSRNEALDRLALGVDCPRCRVGTDEPCVTRRTGRKTLPHLGRIDRACRAYQSHHRPTQPEDTMNSTDTTRKMEWTMVQSCGECGTDAAFLRHKWGEAICRECSHEHPMDRWNLDDGESFEWRPFGDSEVALVLHVTARREV